MRSEQAVLTGAAERALKCGGGGGGGRGEGAGAEREGVSSRMLGILVSLC